MDIRKPKAEKYVNKSLRRALRILDVFDGESERLTATNIANRLETLPGTIYPTLQTLEQFGYLERDENKRYALGLRLLEFAHCVLQRLDLRQIAIPSLRELARQHGVNTHLAVLHDDAVLYLHREEGTPSVVIKEIVGRRVPAYCTALGKVLLAGLSDEAVGEYLESVELVSFAARTITKGDQLMKELKRVREIGHAVDDEEFHDGSLCIAAPIFDYREQVIGAISVSAAKTTATENERGKYVQLVEQAAATVSQRLGCRLDTHPVPLETTGRTR